LKRKLTFIALFALVLVSSVSNAAYEPQGIPIRLLVPIDSPEKLDEVIHLHDSNCRYVGKLERRNGEPEPFFTKLLNQYRGHGGSWSIAVNQKVCGSILSPVALTIPLRNLVAKGGYKVGETVTAYPSNKTKEK
jgi:hypothetical protein